MTKPGYKQSAEHIQKRIKSGPEHPNWLGDKVSFRAGRCRALRRYAPQPCTSCGDKIADRHHIDGNTANNEASNIVFLCRKCHMECDGRLAQFRDSAIRRIAQTTEAAAQEKRSRTKCKRGHLLSGDNVYHNNGRRVCKACRKIHKKNHRERRH